MVARGTLRKRFETRSACGEFSEHACARVEHLGVRTMLSRVPSVMQEGQAICHQCLCTEIDATVPLFTHTVLAASNKLPHTQA